MLQILTLFRIRTLDPRHRRLKRLKNLNSGALKKTDLYNHSNMCQRDSNTSSPVKCHVKTECVFFILLLLLSSINKVQNKIAINVWNIHFTDCISDIILSWAYIRQGNDRKNATYVRVNTKINKHTWHIKVKFTYSDKATNFGKSPPNICPMYCQSNNWWRFCQILWPSQNIWTLSLLRFGIQG